MAHPLTHLTHGIPTRRPFHPAKWQAPTEPVCMPNLSDSDVSGTPERPPEQAIDLQSDPSRRQLSG
jgi:hypothetical protein